METTGKKIWPWSVLGVLTLGLALLVSLPLWLFSPPVLEPLLNHLEKRIGAELAVGSCTADWLGAIRCRDVRYLDQDQGISLKVSRLGLDKGLGQLLLAPGNLGELELDSPLLTIDLHASPPALPGSSVDQSPLPAPVRPPSSPKPDPALGAAGSEKPIWEKLIGRLRLSHGRVQLRGLAAEPLVLAEQLELSARLEQGSVRYELALDHNRSGEQPGRLQAQGFFNLPIRNQAIWPSLVSGTELSLTQLELGAFLPLARRFLRDPSLLPQGSGILDGQWQITTSGLANSRVQGQATIRDLALSGGLLGDDHPRLDQVEILLDGGHSREQGWQVPEFRLESDLITLKGEAFFNREQRRAQAGGTLRLDRLFTLFPQRLRMRGGTRVSEGELSFVAELDRMDGVTRFKGACRAGTLQAEYGEKSLRWDKPLDGLIQLSEEQGRYSVTALELSTPFLSLSGSGSADNFALRASADLKQAVAELQPFLDVHLDTEGKLHFSASSTIQEDERYLLDSRVTIDDFALELAGKPIIPAHRLKLSAQGQAPLSWLKGQGQAQLDIRTATWLGESRLRSSGLERSGGADHGLRGSYDLSASLALEPLAALLNQLELFTVPLAAQGQARWQSFGRLDAAVLEVGGLDLVIDEFGLEYGQISYHDPRVRWQLEGGLAKGADRAVTVKPLEIYDHRHAYQPPVEAWARVDFQEHGLLLPRFSLDSGIVELSEASLSLRDWQSLEKGVEAGFVAGFKLESLAEVLHQLERLPREVALAGEASLVGRLEQTAEQLSLDLEATSSDLNLDLGQESLLRAQPLALAIQLRHEPGSMVSAIPSFRLQSGLLNAEGSATLRGGDQAALELAATLIPEFPALAGLLAQLSNRELSLQGRQRQTLRLSLPLTPARSAGLPALDLSYGGGVEAAAFQGIDIRDLGLAAELKEGRGYLELAAAMNQGRLAFRPELDLAAVGTPGALFLPEPGQLLSEVQLQEPLMRGLLAKVHPLFGVLVQPAGVLSMRAEALSWDLQAARSAAFTTTLDLSKVSLSRNGLLEEILGLLQAGQEPLELKDSEISCQGDQGRIRCSPVHLLVGETEMTLSGSVGYDGSLDYLLQLPLSEALIGREGYRVIGGMVLEIPLQGTVDAPLYSREKISQALARALEQAAVRAVEKQLEQQLDKALPGLFESIFGR